MKNSSVRYKADFLKRLVAEQANNATDVVKLYTMLYDIRRTLEKYKDDYAETYEVWEAELEYLTDAVEKKRATPSPTPVLPSTISLEPDEFDLDSPAVLEGRPTLSSPGLAEPAKYEHEQDLVEQIDLTTESMKMSFLRMHERITRDDQHIERAKKAQDANADITGAANVRSTKFLRSEQVGFMELLMQGAVAMALFCVVLFLL